MAKQGASQRKPAREPIVIQINWRWLGYLLLIMALILLAFWVKQKKWLVISQVSVVGNLYYQDRGEIELIAAKQLKGQDFFSINLANQQQALKQLDWVNQVEISYVWPDQLRLQVSEHFPVCVWNDDYLLNEYGQILPQIQVNLDLPQLRGEQQQAEKVMQKYKILSQRLQDFDFAVKSLEYKSYGSWVLINQHGVKVKMTDIHFNREFERLLAWLTQHTGKLAEVETIDTRYQFGVSVQYRQQGNEG